MIADDVDARDALAAELMLEELLRGCPRNHPEFEAALRAALRRHYATARQVDPVECETEREELLATAPMRH